MLFIATIVLLSAVAHGVLIGFFPGLDELIEKADAIVILRIEKRLSDYSSFSRYNTYECYIDQTLKGKIPVKQRIRLQLMDSCSSFVSSFADKSTHLVFLTGKRTPDEPVDYRSLEMQGANIRISPLGHDEIPEGATIKEKIQALLVRTLEYNQKQHEEEQRFLEKMLKGNGDMTETAKTPPQFPAISGTVE